MVISKVPVDETQNMCIAGSQVAEAAAWVGVWQTAHVELPGFLPCHSYERSSKRREGTDSRVVTLPQPRVNSVQRKARRVYDVSCLLSQYSGGWGDGIAMAILCYSILEILRQLGVQWEIWSQRQRIKKKSKDGGFFL